MSRTVLKTPLVASRRLVSTHSLDFKPDLSNLHLRWAKMKELDQADILDYLQAQSSKNWNNLDINDKKALYYIYWGEWGPRATVKSTPTSQILLNGWFYGFLIAAVGVGYYNWQIDQKHEERYNTLQVQVKELQEQKKAQEESSTKSWWKLWK